MKVMANSIPKGGTHLLLRLITLIGFQENPFWIGAELIRGRYELIKSITRGAYSGNRILIGSEVPIEIGANWLKNGINRVPAGSVFGAHCLHSKNFEGLLASCGVSVVCMLRDPRSIAASHLDYLSKSPNHFFHKYYMALDSDEERLEVTILGGKLGPYRLRSLADRYSEYTDWQRSGVALNVRFEDLVGERGGGSDNQQRESIIEAMKFLGVEVTDEKVTSVQENMFGATRTFRNGKIDGWRSELPKKHLKIINETMGDMLVEMGYAD